MLEVRIHGRGGQGAVTSAELVALAAINEGKFAQSMPSFGPERRGAPVQAFLRVSDEKIRFRGEILKPDVVVVLDEGLLSVVDVTSGLKSGGCVVVNTKLTPEGLRRAHGFKDRIVAVDASKIAREVLGVPITNTTMVGALLKAVDIVPLEAMKNPIDHRFNPKLAAKNIAAMEKAFQTAVMG